MNRKRKLAASCDVCLLWETGQDTMISAATRPTWLETPARARCRPAARSLQKWTSADCQRQTHLLGSWPGSFNIPHVQRKTSSLAPADKHSLWERSRDCLLCRCFLLLKYYIYCKNTLNTSNREIDAILIHFFLLWGVRAYPSCRGPEAGYTQDKSQG